MLEKDLAEIAELEAINRELLRYHDRLPAAPPSDAVLVSQADPPSEAHAGSVFRDPSGSLAARKAALLVETRRLRLAIDARETPGLTTVPFAGTPPKKRWNDQKTLVLGLALGGLIVIASVFSRGC